MDSSRIQTGSTEPVICIALGPHGERLSGVTTLFLSIRRVSDSTYFDWGDNYFKASPTSPLQQLAEVNSSMSPGEYWLNSGGHTKGFHTSLIQNPAANDCYRLLAIDTSAPNVTVNFPQAGEIKVGEYVDYIDTDISSRAEYADLLNAMRDFGLDHLVAVNPGGAPPVTNTYIKQLLDAQALAYTKLNNMYTVKHNWSFDPSTDKLIGNAWLEANNAMVPASSTCGCTWFDKDGAVLFSLVGTGPTANGVFYLEKVGPAFLAHQPYYCITTVGVTGFGPVTGAKAAYIIN